MFTIFNVVAPIFGLVAAGFLSVRYRLYPNSGVGGLIAFVNNFATPCLLFRAMLEVDFASAFNIRIVGSFYIGALICFVLGIVISRTLFADTPGKSIVGGFSGMFTNTALLGIPIISRAYGDDALIVIYMIIGFHAPILLTTGIITMEMARRDGGALGPAVAAAGKRVVTSPLLIGIFLGVVGNVFNVSLIEPVDAFTKMMAQAVLPVALFGLGGALNDYKIRDNWRQAALVGVLKTFLHPAIAWVLMVPVFHVDHDIARYAVVLAAMPTGINAYIFATSFQRSVDVAANTILITTAGAVLSVSFWLYVVSL